MNIIIEYILFGIKAHLKDKPEVEGFGATKDEAVGDLVLKNPQMFQIEITDKSGI